MSVSPFLMPISDRSVLRNFEWTFTLPWNISWYFGFTVKVSSSSLIKFSTVGFKKKNFWNWKFINLNLKRTNLFTREHNHSFYMNFFDMVFNIQKDFHSPKLKFNQEIKIICKRRSFAVFTITWNEPLRIILTHLISVKIIVQHGVFYA